MPVDLSKYGLLVTDGDKAQALYKGLLGLGSQLMAGSAPSLQPGGFQRGMAAGGQAFQKGYQGHINDTLGRQVQGMQAVSAQQQMEAQKAEMARKQQQQLAMDRYASARAMGGKDMAGNPVDMDGLLYQAAPRAMMSAEIQDRFKDVTPYTDEGKIQSDLDAGVITPQQAMAARARLATGKAPTAKWAWDRQAKTFVPVTDAALLQSPQRYTKESPNSGMDPTKEWGMGPDGNPAMTPKGVARAEEQWRTRLSKPLQGLQEIDRKMRIVSKALEAQNGTADIAAINAYQRMIDDGVVRSEDVRLQGEAVSLLEQLKLWQQKVKEGDLLPAGVRQRMHQMAQELSRETVAGHRTIVSGYRSVIEDTPGLKWNRVFPKEFESFFSAGTQGPAASTDTMDDVEALIEKYAQ